MDFIYSGFSNIGKRKINQDSYSVQVAETDSGKVFFSVVCDGVGGLKSGEVASATAVAYFASWFRKVFCNCSEALQNDMDYLRDELFGRISTLNAEIIDCTTSAGIKSGTTIAIALITGRRSLIVNVGDSRVYLIRNGQAACVSTDHTVAKMKKDENRPFSEKENNMLYQCLGGTATLRPDSFVFDTEPNDVIVLCTDGFHRRLSEKEMILAFDSRLISTERQLNATHKMIANKVKTKGESDNITAVTALIK